MQQCIIVERRIRLSNAALTKLLNVWIKGDKIKRKTKLKLYRSLVKSILVYNCGTWALTKSEEEKLNAFHRKQLRKVLNIKYPVKIRNSSLYNKCEEHPLSIYILENRWRLFGHILRRNIEIPANKSMNSYFATHGKKFRGRPLTTLPVVLNKDLSRLQENTLQLTTREALEHLRCIAQNRQQWRELSTRIRKAAEAPASDDWDAEGPKSSKSCIIDWPRWPVARSINMSSFILSCGKDKVAAGDHDLRNVRTTSRFQTDDGGGNCSLRLNTPLMNFRIRGWLPMVSLWISDARILMLETADLAEFKAL